MAKINIFGDFCVKSVENLLFKEDLARMLRAAALNVVNFEAPVKVKDAGKIEKIGPCLSHDEAAPDFLEKQGFGLITLANNHAMDFGGESLLNTISLFKNSTVVGAGTWDEAYRVKTVEIEGKKFGFLGLTHREFGVLTDEDFSSEQVGTAWMLHPCVDKVIVDAKKEVDFLFVLPHAGVEHEAYPLPELVSLYRHYIDLGADGVFASHPHIPQGWEFYEGKPIFYSLGNFCLDPVEKRERPFLKYALVVSVEIENGEIHSEVHCTKYDFETGSVSLTNDELIVRHLEEINETMTNKDAYLKIVDDYCERVLSDFSPFFAKAGYYEYSTVRFVKQLVRKMIGKRERPNPNYFIHLMRCESHRWAILRALENRKQK